MKLMWSMTLTVVGAFFMSMPLFAADRCAGTAPDAEAWAAEKLNEAKAARVRGDYDRANEILYLTASGFPRAADISIESRCMGQQNWQRYYEEKQLTYLELGRRAEKSDKKTDGSFAGFSYYVEGDNRSDVERMLTRLPDNPIQVAGAGNLIRKKLFTYEWALDHGFTLLAEEQASQKYFQTRLDRLIENSRSRGNALLRSEAAIISADVTEDELQMKDAEQDAAALLGALIGDDSILPANEARNDTARAKRSRIQLGEARLWLVWITPEEAAPVLVRAVERGDVMLARADDTTIGLEARDDYYAAAIRYYELADANVNVANAKQSRKAIVPALKTERAEREAILDEKAAKMESSIKDFQQSMEKSAAEKESFKSEADSLEDELDF